MSEIKEGQPFPNYLNREMSTITVIHSEFGDQVMTINVETFDPEIHKRCNVLGQLTDEKGRLIDAKDKEAVNKSKGAGPVSKTN